MAQNSKIEWTDHTANLWLGCTKVHEGCDHCYAETLSKRWGQNVWGNDKPRREVKSVWKDFSKYQRLAREAGEIHRVFVGSMMDIFEKPMPLVDSKGASMEMSTEDLRQIFFRDVVPASPNLLFLLLTKRPSNINKYIPQTWKENPPENVMFGTSPVNQVTADKLIPQLLQVSGNKFLSIEPQLGKIDLARIKINHSSYVNSFCSGINWVINGGESGHNRRPFNLEWAYDLKEQCKAIGVPYFFKQIDKVLPVPEDLMVREFPKIQNEVIICLLDKK